MLSLSNDPDDGSNGWPWFTYVLAESLRRQNGDLPLFNPTMVGFWWAYHSLTGKIGSLKRPAFNLKHHSCLRSGALKAVMISSLRTR